MTERFQRRLFIDSRLKIFALLFAIYHVLLLLGWVYVASRQVESQDQSKGLFVQDTFLTINLLILSLATFFLAFLWSRRKYTAIVDRIDDFCRLAMSGKAAKFTFRTYDPFRFFAETFNKMIVKVAKIRRLTHPDYGDFIAAMRTFPEDPTEEDWQRLQNSIETMDVSSKV